MYQLGAFDLHTPIPLISYNIYSFSLYLIRKHHPWTYFSFLLLDINLVGVCITTHACIYTHWFDVVLRLVLIHIMARNTFCQPS